MLQWFDNLISFVSTGETDTAARERGEGAERRLAELNREDAEVYGPEWYQETLRSDARQDKSDELTVSNEFENGWDDALAERRNAVGSVLGFSLKTFFGLLPWYVWLAIGGFLAFKFGLLKGLLKK